MGILLQRKISLESTRASLGATPVKVVAGLGKQRQTRCLGPIERPFEGLVRPATVWNVNCYRIVPRNELDTDRSCVRDITCYAPLKQAIGRMKVGSRARYPGTAADRFGHSNWPLGQPSRHRGVGTSENLPSKRWEPGTLFAAMSASRSTLVAVIAENGQRNRPWRGWGKTARSATSIGTGRLRAKHVALGATVRPGCLTERAERR